MLQEFIERQKQQTIYEITSLGGNIFYVVVVLLFLVLWSYDVFNQLFFGIILIYFVILVIKLFYFKERPVKYNYSNFMEKIEASAFPSVHAARGAFLAAVLIGHFGNLIISVILAIMAVLVAYSRISLKKHDLNDVIGGIVLGILVYFLVKNI